MAVKIARYIFRGQEYLLTKNADTGLYEATISAPSVSSYSQANHKFGGQIIAEDTAGNTATVDEKGDSNLLLRVMERVAPVISVTYPTASALITDSTPTIKWKVTDNDSGVASSSLSVDGKAVTSDIVKTAITGGYEYSYTPTTALADGKHTISIGASDNDGNAASAKSVSFTVDTVPPTLNVTAPTNGLVTNKASVTVVGNTDDATSKPVTITVNGQAATVNTDGTFSKELTLSEGSNTITVIAKDRAGKTTTVIRKVTLDTVAPVIHTAKITPNPVDCGATFIISVQIDD